MSKTSTIALCIGVMQCVSSLIIEKNFREVFLDETWLQNAKTTNSQTVSPVITRSVISTVPSALCVTISWCRIICQNEVDNFLMSDIFVLPFVNDRHGNNALKCWTLSRGSSFDLNTVSVVAHSPTFTKFPNRIPENLLDEIFNFQNRQCWVADYSNNPYVLFDLQTLTTISRVTIVGQNGLNIVNHFRKIEIRLGNSSVTGNDFSSYTLLGYYDGTPSPNIIFEAMPLNPQVGRFLAIQRLSTTDRLQVCHLEIYA